MALVVVSILCASAPAAGPPTSGDPALGERLYREGILPSGKTLAAQLAGDVSVDGSSFPCANCHLRSGLGTKEGNLVTPPVNWTNLVLARGHGVRWQDPDEAKFNRAERNRLPSWSRDAKGVPPPWVSTANVRPAYTEASVVRAIREGIDPTGRRLNPIMPRYALSDADAAHLLAYLRTLSAGYSPGVTSTTLRFATVIGPDVPDDQVDAMLSVLEIFVPGGKEPSRGDGAGAAASGSTPSGGYGLAHRRLSLSEWRLSGPPDGWPRQLAALYAREPVFALLGGIVGGDWAPIHHFCERMRIPEIFPVTRGPALGAANWYTLYFSEGAYREGAAAARYIQRTGPDGPHARVVQVSGGDAASALAAKGFSATWAALGGSPIVERRLADSRALGPAGWSEIVAAERPDVLVLWVHAEQAATAATLVERRRPAMLIFSGSLLGDRLDAIPPAVRPLARVTYPYSIPGASSSNTVDLSRWLVMHGLPETHPRIRSQMYVLGWLLSSAIATMGDDFYRDRLVDAFGMLPDQAFTAAGYPRLSFGPGQRYALKGCYVVRLAGDTQVRPEALTDWLVD